MTVSVTLMFPGQGSQYAGMGKNLTGDSARYMEIADKVLGHSLSSLMMDGPEEELKLTHNAQPAILVHSLALLERLLPELRSRGITISGVMGHSVGEYAALVAAGALGFEDAIKAVRLRGLYMQEAVPPSVGKMIAIMRSDEASVRRACEAASTPDSQVMPANFNGPDQIVISGHAEACTRAVEWLTANSPGKFRSIELNVSAPFHSGLMRPAALKLAQAFAQFRFHPTKLPYIANIDAREYPAGTDPVTVQKNLVDQVAGSVLWAQRVLKLPSGSKCFEVGPGKVLAGLVKKINPDIQVLSLDQGPSDATSGLIQEFLA